MSSVSVSNARGSSEDGSPSTPNSPLSSTSITFPSPLNPTVLLASVQKGESWLSRNARAFVSEAETGLSWKDNFLEALLLEVTGNWNLVDLRIPSDKWNYFAGRACALTTDPYPDDIDTQCMLGTIIKSTDAKAHALMDEIMANPTVDGIVPTYFGSSRLRICPEVATNVCCMFYTYGRGHEVQPSFDYVLETLQDRAWHLSRYYPQPEPLFWYVFRLCKTTKHELDSTITDPDLNADVPTLPFLLNLDNLEDLNDKKPNATTTTPPPVSKANITNNQNIHALRTFLLPAVTERIGRDALDNPICLAIRLLICQHYGIPNEADVEALLALQDQKDGKWDQGWFFAFGESKIRIQNKGLTTGMAVQALKRCLSRSWRRDRGGTEGRKGSGEG